MGPALSLVIPAYNEAKRLPPYLATVRQYLEQRYGAGYEVIVVDDGSRDGLADELDRLSAAWPQLRVMRHRDNRGKGAAVRTGMLAARGELLLFADADGATPIEEETRLAQAVQAGADVAVGSRTAAAPGVQRRRTWIRGLAGAAFTSFAKKWLPLSVKDTQCGFKMFRRDSGRELFSLSCESGYLFDLELLVLADRLGCRIVEVPITWSDVPGGHLSLTRESLKIPFQMWRLRRRLAGTRRASSRSTRSARSGLKSP